MILGAPWALAGLAAIAVPILIHALTRQRAIRTPFPTLRFVPSSALTIVRRHRPTDLLLLLLRGAVVAAAAFGLAQPYFLTAARMQGANARVDRAIVIDTSPSMERVTADGRRAVVAAREAARQLSPVATAETMIDAPRLSAGIAEAAAWLNRTPGRRELIVVSDYQLGSIAEADLAAIDRETTIRFVSIEAAGASTVSAPAARIGDRSVVATMTLGGDRTEIVWRDEGTAGEKPRGIRVLFGDDEREIVEASMRAAAARSVPAAPSPNPIAIVLPGARERAALLERASPLDAPWMFDVYDRIVRDPLVAEAAGRAPGREIVTAGAGQLDRVPTLLIFPSTSDGLIPAAVISAAMRAAPIKGTVPLDELEPLTIDTTVLARWADPNTRPGANRTADMAPPGESDARWFWALALVLLGVEFVVRRRPSSESRVGHDRAA